MALESLPFLLDFFPCSAAVAKEQNKNTMKKQIRHKEKKKTTPQKKPERVRIGSGCKRKKNQKHTQARTEKQPHPKTSSTIDVTHDVASVHHTKNLGVEKPLDHN